MLEKHIYTPLTTAIEQLDERQRNVALRSYLCRALPHGLPAVIQEGRRLVLFRHIATPNQEVDRFLSLASQTPGHQPAILEYHQDQFNDRNQTKHLLGKLRFDKGTSKHGERLFERMSVINFNISNTRPLAAIRTHWGQALIDFHHELFSRQYPSYVSCASDISTWLHLYGGRATEYYKPFFTLFVRDAILFENVRLDKKEAQFTEAIMLPALREIESECGYKPLIVMLAPSENEADDFWYSYPHSIKAWVGSKYS